MCRTQKGNTESCLFSPVKSCFRCSTLNPGSEPFAVHTRMHFVVYNPCISSRVLYLRNSR